MGNENIYKPEELLGPLNEVEQKYAPATLYVSGKPDILAHGGRISIVGARKAHKDSLARA